MATNPVLASSADYTGQSSFNRVVNETHVNLGTKLIRSVVPTYSPFFAQGLVVRDHANGAVLTEGVDYKAVDLMTLASAMTNGLLVYRTLLILKPGVVGVEIDYQALGGKWTQSFSTSQALLDNLTQDARPPSWDNMINRPAQGYTPTAHMQSAQDLIGLEYLVEAINTLKDSILMGDVVGHAAIYAYLDAQLNIIKTTIQSYQDNTAVIALANSQNALLQVAAAQSQITAQITVIEALQQQVALASEKADALFSAQAGDEAAAIALLAAHP